MSICATPVSKSKYQYLTQAFLPYIANSPGPTGQGVYVVDRGYALSFREFLF